MGAPYELESQNVGWAWALTVAGLPVQYVSHDGYPARALPVQAGNYRSFTALEGPESEGGELDLAGGVASYDAMVVTLLGNPKFPASADDPALVLTNISTRSSTFLARLIVTVAAAGTPAELVIDRDASGLTFPTVVHTGQEAWAVSGAGGTGTEVDPYTLTVTARAVLGTQARRHVVSVAEASRPWLEDTVTAWGWRRCTLYARPLRFIPGGGLGFGEEVEIRRGFIEEPPKPGRDDTWGISILALPAVLDKRPTGTTDTIRPVDGWHYFADGLAVTVEHAQRMRAAGFFNETATDVSAIGSEEVNAPTFKYAESFDDSLPDGHPRRGRLVIGNAPGDVGLQVEAAAGGVFTTPANTPNSAVAIGDRVSNAAFIELHRVDVAGLDVGDASLQKWPQDAIALINASTGWAPGTTQGDDGMHADVQIVNHPDGGFGLAVVWNTDARLDALDLLFWGAGWSGTLDERPEHWRSGAAESPAGRWRQLHYPLDFADPDDDRFTGPIVQGADERVSGAVGRPWDRAVRFIRNTDATLTRPRLRGVATWFYQSGERYIGPVDAALDIPAVGSIPIEIEYTDRATGDRLFATTEVVSVVELGDPVIGYALEVTARDRDRLPSFGNWPGLEPAVIRPITRMWDQTSATALRRFLLGAGGELANAFDRDPFGAGLDLADVAADRFATPDTPGLDRWSPILRPGDKIREVVDGMLLATSSALVVHRGEQGECRLARVSVGLEAEHEVVHDITDADLLDLDTRTDSSGRIVGAVKVAYNHRRSGDGDPASETTIPAQHILDRHADAETLEIDARGLYIGGEASDALAILRHLLARVVALLGEERLQWQLRVPLGLGIRLTLGSVVRVTSEHLVGHQKAGASPWGISGLLGRVVAYETDYSGDEPSVLLTVHHTGNRSSGVNWAAQIESIPSTTSAILTANPYSLTRHPYTGAAWLDIDAIAVGDSIDFCPRYDQDAFVTRIVSAVVRATRRIDVTVAHGAAVGDLIKPPAWSAASAYSRRHVFVGDNLGEVDGAPGFELT